MHKMAFPCFPSFPLTSQIESFFGFAPLVRIPRLDARNEILSGGNSIKNHSPSAEDIRSQGKGFKGQCLQSIDFSSSAAAVVVGREPCMMYASHSA